MSRLGESSITYTGLSLISFVDPTLRLFRLGPSQTIVFRRRRTDQAIEHVNSREGRNISYAVAGGVACVIHGLDRVTDDLDLAIEVMGHEVVPIKNLVVQVDPRFILRGVNLYFQPRPSDQQEGDGTRSETKVEMLAAIDSYTFPNPLDQCFTLFPVVGHQVRVLVPIALLFSKVPRWYQLSTGTSLDRLQTQETIQKDLSDMRFLADLLRGQPTIEIFGLYPPKKRSALRRALTSLASDDVDLSFLLQLLPTASPDEAAGELWFGVQYSLTQRLTHFCHLPADATSIPTESAPTPLAGGSRGNRSARGRKGRGSWRPSLT